MVFYGLATADERGRSSTGTRPRRRATSALRDVLTDEPEWRGRMSVLEIDFANETAAFVLR